MPARHARLSQRQRLLLLASLMLAAVTTWAAVTAPPVATYWLALRGQATDVAVTPGGNAYALDRAGHTWWLDAGRVRPGTGWTRQAGQFARVRAGHDGTFWAVNAGGVLYRRDGSSWRRVATAVRDVAVTPDAITLLLMRDGRLRTWPDDTRFEPSPPSSASEATALVADEHGLPWLLRADGSAWRFSGTAWEQAGRNLEDLAIGLEGSAFAIDRNGVVLKRQSGNGRWTAYATTAGTVPRARLVRVGGDGLPWLVTRDGEILAERPVTAATDIDAPGPPATFTRLLRWQPMAGGTARELDIGSDGTVYSVAYDDTVWRWQESGGWMLLPGRLASITAGSEGRAWGLDARGRILQMEHGFWRNLPLQATHLAAGGDDHVLAILANGVLSRWDAKAASWRAIAAATVDTAWLAVGDDGEPWRIDATGTVQVLEAGKWQPVPGIRAATVDIGADGTVYATSREQSIYWLDRVDRQWKPATGKAARIAVGPEGAPWAVAPDGRVLASNRFIERQEARLEQQRQQEIASKPPVMAIVAGPLPTLDKPLQYQRVPASVQDIGIGANGAVFAIGSEGALMCFSNPELRFLAVSAGQLRRVAVAADGSPWTLGNNGIVSRFEGSRWLPVPELVAGDIAVGANGDVWAAGIDGQAYRYDRPVQRFRLVPVLSSDAAFKAERIAGGRDGAAWIVGTNHHLYRCDKGNCRMRLAGAVDVDVAPDGAVFALDLLGGVRRYDERSMQFEARNGSGVAIAVGPQGLPWLVTLEGQVEYAGLLQVGSRRVNTAGCAASLGGAQVPAFAPATSLEANDDVATLSPGDVLRLLDNDRHNGQPPTLEDMALSFDSATPLLRLEGDIVRVAADATPGMNLRASYRLCPKVAFGVCSNARIMVSVALPAIAIAPGAPTAATALAGDAQVLVSFMPPANDGGSPITAYTVVDNFGDFAVVGSTSPLLVGGLSNGVTYTFTVTATNAAGTGPASAPSNPATPQASIIPVVPDVPGAPSGITAIGGDGQATVSFTAPADDGGSPITGYTVMDNFGDFTVTGPASPMQVTGLSNGVAYTFTVMATNAAGTGPASAPSNPVTPQASIVPVAPDVPGAPTGITASAGDAQATIGFSAPDDDGGAPITSYIATSSPGGLSAGGAAPPLVVAGLANGTPYTFTITAGNAAGMGPASAPSNSVTPQSTATVPGAPTGINATAGDEQATINFVAPASDGGSPITGYTVTDNFGDFSVNGTGSPLVATGLINGVGYTFRVAASNAIGTGPASAPSNGVTPQAPLTVPGLPLNPSPDALGQYVEIHFDPPASDGGSAITSYTMTVNPGGAIVTGPGSPLGLAGVNNGVQYALTVAATNAIGTGPATAPVLITPYGSPSVPLNVEAHSASGTSITVTFDPPTDNGGSPITGYTATESWGNTMVSGPSSPLVFPGLLNGEVYTVTVNAETAFGTGVQSPPTVPIMLGTPSEPLNVTAVPGGAAGEIEVSFDPPYDMGSASASGYTADCTPTGAGVPGSNTGAASPILVGALTTGESYTCNVWVENDEGGTSVPSDPSGAVIVP